jgi:hypothetical protein
MARSAGEVQADIALTRAEIERDLEALHRHVPKRSWVAYAWLAGGLAVGLMLSGMPVLTVLARGLRIAELGGTLMGFAALLGSVSGESRSHHP